MLAQRRPHIALRIRHADLAQEPRDGPQQRNVAPGQARRHHQRVVAVVLGDTAHHHDEAGFQRRLHRLERGRPAVVPLQRHVVQPGAGLAIGDLEGPLVDDPEAHILQHRHPLGQRDRPAVTPDLQSDARILRPRRG